MRIERFMLGFAAQLFIFKKRPLLHHGHWRPETLLSLGFEYAIIFITFDSQG